MGAIIRHGPHQGAQKSTTSGVSAWRWRAKDASSSSTGWPSNNTWPHLPQWAWAGSPDDDAKIMAAMKAGSSAVATARSGRGTQTVDTFSLSGISAALDEAAKRCAN